MSNKTSDRITIFSVIVILVIALLWFCNSPNMVSLLIIVASVICLKGFRDNNNYNNNNISLDDDVPLNERHTYFSDLSDEEIEYDYMQHEQEKQDEEDYYLQQRNKG